MKRIYTLVFCLFLLLSFIEPGRGTAAAWIAASGVNSDITSLIGLTIPLPILEGGTGSATPPAGRGALGVAASGANSDIASLSGGGLK